MEEFDMKFKAVMEAGSKMYRADGIYNNNDEFQADRQKANAAVKSALENDFCPWVISNKTRIPTAIRNQPQFGKTIVGYCPNFPL